MAVKGILFDFDGTLANTIDLILAAFHHTCREVLGRDLPDERIIKTFGLILPDAMLELSGRQELVDPMRDVYREYNNAHHDSMIKVIPGALETVRELRERGVRMAVVTSKKNAMAHRGLRCCGLEDYMDAVVAYGDTVHTKPHPEPMQAACRMMGVRPEECISVGDSPFDLISGRSAGAMTAAVRYTTFSWQEMLDKGKPDYILEKINDLPLLIDQIASSAAADSSLRR